MSANPEVGFTVRDCHGCSRELGDWYVHVQDRLDRVFNQSACPKWLSLGRSRKLRLDQVQAEDALGRAFAEVLSSRCEHSRGPCAVKGLAFRAWGKFGDRAVDVWREKHGRDSEAAERARLTDDVVRFDDNLEHRTRWDFGESIVDQVLARQVLSRVSTARDSHEFHELVLAASGYAGEEIAAALSVGHATVRKRVQRQRARLIAESGVPEGDGHKTSQPPDVRCMGRHQTGQQSRGTR